MEFDTKQELSIYDYDSKIDNYYKAISLHPNISEDTAQLIQAYHNAMVSEGLAKATQTKHLEILFSLSKMIDYEWKDITKEMVDNLTLRIMKTYSDAKGKETHSSRDHKKILKIFVRWFRLGSRKFTDVGNPPEIAHVN